MYIENIFGTLYNLYIGSTNIHIFKALFAAFFTTCKYKRKTFSIVSSFVVGLVEIVPVISINNILPVLVLKIAPLLNETIYIQNTVFCISQIFPSTFHLMRKRSFIQITFSNVETFKTNE